MFDVGNFHGHFGLTLNCDLGDFYGRASRKFDVGNFHGHFGLTLIFYVGDFHGRASRKFPWSFWINLKFSATLFQG